MKRARYLLSDPFPPPTGRYDVGRRDLYPMHEPEARDTPRICLFYPVERHAPGQVGRDRGATRQPDVSIANAVPAQSDGARFPLVVYFSGWPGNVIDNYSLICELVSHGMSVAAVTYPAARGDMDYSSEPAYLRTVREANRLVAQRAGHASALLERLEVDTAAVLGFSFGGAVAAEAALLDGRFCAAVNIDGRPWGRALHEGVPARYLFLGGERPMPSSAALTSSDPDRRYNAQLDVVDIQELPRNLSRHGGIHVTVSHVDHLDFIDGALRWSRRRWLRRTRIDPRRVLEVTRSHVGAFVRHAFGMQASPTPHAAHGAGVRVEVYVPTPIQ